MNTGLKGMLLILALGLLTVGCSGTLKLEVVNPPTPVAGPSADLPATTAATATETTVASKAPDTPSPSPAAGAAYDILVDDFVPQPYQGQAVYFFNRIEGDRGALNDSIQVWGDGQVTTKIAGGKDWGGVWMSLNHPIREGLAIDLSAALPTQIAPAYQSQITGMTVRIAGGTANRTLKLELKTGNHQSWVQEVRLEGGEQVLAFDLPSRRVNHLVWVLDHAALGDYVVLDRISFAARTQVTDTATAAFVWSYGMLLANWDPATGLVRDKAKDASGEFDAIQATGSLAAATAIAEQMGVVGQADAVQIVDKIGEALLQDLPRFHGLWPHWVKNSSGGGLEIVENTEWSSVDTVIAALGLLEGQAALGIDTAATETMLQEIEWSNLITPHGISHGYTYSGDLIPYAWDAFGGESWLVELACAGATGQIIPFSYPLPPTANGSGFIDELAWLFVPPPPEPDYWGTDWQSYRATAAAKQVSYHDELDSGSCFAELGLFGLSAAEVPAPSMVALGEMYQPYGAGGSFAAANDGSSLLGTPVVAPHYSAMIASLRPEEAIVMWDWLIDNGLFSPLTNVESLMFPEGTGCDPETVVWNQLKGSWNLALQTLGWGRYLAERAGHVPVLWQAAETNPLLQKGYLLLTPRGASSPAVEAGAWLYQRECEYPDEETVGQALERSNASGSKVHGQFGTVAAWPAKSGSVTFDNIHTPQIGTLFLRVRHSKYSSATVPILVFVDDETEPRATFLPADQGDWNTFTWTGPIALGSIESGSHSIRFATDGQEYGVADFDRFVLANSPELLPAP